MPRAALLQQTHVRGRYWPLPTMTAPNTYVITDDPASRYLTLATNEDAYITFAGVQSASTIANPDASRVTIIGGRNLIVRGGEVNIPNRGPVARITTAMAAGDTTLTVASTTGFPTAGYLRVDGEGMIYTGITATTFTGITRDHGFFNSGATSSNTTHPVGAKVYQGEGYRSGFEFNSQTGTVDIEGVAVTGTPNDGFRFSGQIPLVQMHNVYVAPVQANDTAYDTDGHPDAIQFFGGGTTAARISRTTLMAGIGGRCILNAANDTGSTAVGSITLRDVELCRAHPDAIELLTNSTATTVWDVQNSWFRNDGKLAGTRGSLTTDTTLLPKFNQAHFRVQAGPPSGRNRDIVNPATITTRHQTQAVIAPQVLNDAPNLIPAGAVPATVTATV